jgi:hypothetical protein
MRSRAAIFASTTVVALASTSAVAVASYRCKPHKPATTTWEFTGSTCKTLKAWEWYYEARGYELWFPDGKNYCFKTLG